MSSRPKSDEEQDDVDAAPEPTEAATLPGKDKAKPGLSTKDPEAGIRADGDSEARELFPMSPTSDQRSSYHQQSYLYPYNPDPLCSGNRYDTYDEMRKDQQVKSCLSLKKDLVVNSGWEVECDDETAKDEIERDLREMSDRQTVDNGFEDALREVMSSYDYGFSVSEVIAKLEDGRYQPKSILTRAPHTWQFDLDEKGRLRKLLQAGASGFKPLNPAHFLHHTYQSEFGNPYGTSDLQAAHAPWKAKKFFIRMFAVYAERFASPTIVARYKAGAQEDEINAIQEMAKSIQNSTALTLPEDVAVDFVQAARDATEAYVRGIALWDMMIGRAVLVPDLMGVSGEKTSGGSFSLGATQLKLFLGTIQKDRISLERKVNLRIVRPFARLNYGDKVDPKFKLLPWSDDDAGKNLELFIKLTSLKAYKVTPEELDHFRKQIKFPTPPIEVLDPQPITVDEDGNPLPQPKGKAPGAPEDGKEEPGKDGKPLPKKPAAVGKPAPDPKRRDFNDASAKLLIYRDLSAFERKVDFTMVKRTLDVAERAMDRSVGDAAGKMAADLVRIIREGKFLTRFQPEMMMHLQPGFGREMNQAMRSEFRSLWRESAEEARREILPAGEKRAFTSEDLLPEDFERILEAETFKLVGDYRTELTKRATNRLIKGIKDGASEGALVKLLREETDEYRTRWLSTLTRTKTTEIYNAARKSTWDNDPVISQIVSAYQFSSVLDERTSDVCRHLDGKIFEKGAFVDRTTPPLHFNCRSILVPITKFEEYKADKPESLSKIKDLGGNLVFNETTALPSSIEEGPLLVATVREDKFGEHILVKSPGAGRLLHIHSIAAYNEDMQAPVKASVIAVSGTGRVELASGVLPRGGGRMDFDYRQSSRVLAEDSDVRVVLSAEIPVTFTVEYSIHELGGKRLQ